MTQFTGYLAQYGAFPVLVDATGGPRFCHWGKETPRSRPPTEIVLHYSSGPPDISFDRVVIYLTKANPRHVSAHFVVGREGQVALICPLNVIAWHAGKWSRNCTSIGIECVHANDDGPYPDAQLEALVRLCAQLCELFGIDPATGIVGHRDIMPTVCPRGLDVDWVKTQVKGQLDDATARATREECKMARSYLKDLLNKDVRARTLDGALYGEGRVVAIYSQPICYIERPDGARFPWVASLCFEQKSEGMRGDAYGGASGL